MSSEQEIKHRHFILNKPFGYLSQFVNNQSRRKNKKLLGELYDFPEEITDGTIQEYFGFNIKDYGKDFIITL